MTDPLRARLGALSEWARSLPDRDPESALEELVEVMGSDEQADELLRRVGAAPPPVQQ